MKYSKEYANNDIMNLLCFLKKNINSKDDYKEYVSIRIPGITNLFRLFEQDNRIYTVIYDNISFIRYILMENNKVLKLSLKWLDDQYIITYELFSNANNLEIETIMEIDGRKRIQIKDDTGRSICSNNEILSLYNKKVLPRKVPLVYVLSPITIEELVQKFKKIIKETLGEYENFFFDIKTQRNKHLSKKY